MARGFAESANGGFHIAWKDSERVFSRGWRKNPEGSLVAVLEVRPISENPDTAILDRLAHEYGWKDDLDSGWALRPLDLVHEGGRTALVLQDPGGEPLAASMGGPMGVERFLRLAIGIGVAVGGLHQRGLVHKDIKPQNVIVVDPARSEVRLTGFGIASRLRRERQSLQPPETIAGTLAYMSPEQTGWMNRSVDSRSDLYALGVTLYGMLTGSLPFAASDPMDWVHCHIAREPTAPADLAESIPSVLSMIVLKLLAKAAEDRYQTAGGLVRDLRRCLADFEDQGQITEFPLGQHDTSDRMTMPEKLYGREREIDTLLASFDRIVEGGEPELVLVSGYPGIGKSSVVHELHKMLVLSRGFFAAGKFDQYKRDIPYSTVAQALRGLIQPLLAKSDAQLAGWRDALKEALGGNGQLIIDLVPELTHVIGDQPLVPELRPKDAQYRFQLVFRRFLGVFARPEHPLALFIDDLQWVDVATLELIDDLLTRSGLKHLILIGAYRDNEVDASHPLMRKLEAIRHSGARVRQIQLRPLGRKHLRELITDAIRCEPVSASRLASLVQKKTGGNPFFAIQFLQALADEGLLTYDVDVGRWSWQLDRLHAKGLTDNVVDLMVGRLVRRPEKTLHALQQFACLGTVAHVSTLAIVLETSHDQIHSSFGDALSQELVELQGDSYRFIHDRVQEAAYSMLPEASRAAAHLRIGRLLTAHVGQERTEEAIFDIVGHFSRGIALVTSRKEREEIAQLNLIAGKRAKASTAYSSALSYFRTGMELLSEQAWEHRQELAFELERHRADCEIWMGALSSAEERLAALAPRAVGTVQRAAVASRRVELYTMLGKSERAVEIGLEYLRHVGIEWAPHPTQMEARREYQRVWSLLGDRESTDVINLPLMRDPELLATYDVTTALGAPVIFTDWNLYTLLICSGINLSMEHGNSDASPPSFAAAGLAAGYLLGDYDAGYRLGKLACDLTEARGLMRFGALTYSVFALLTPWIKPIRDSFEPAQRALQIATEQGGDLTYAASACRHLCFSLLASGEQLDRVAREAEHALQFSRKMGSDFVANIIRAPLALVRMLRGETEKFGCFDHKDFSERVFEERMTGNVALALPECFYWIRKLQARVFAGDYMSAIDAAHKAEQWLATSRSLSIYLLEQVAYHFYAALAHAGCCQPEGPDPYVKHQAALAAHHSQLRTWEVNCPANFEDSAALVGAEIARVEGRVLDAERLYEQAIHSARGNGFVHNEAIAYELAARFYSSRGFEQFAREYLATARDVYLRWGALGKAQQLEQVYPGYRDENHLRVAAGPPVEHLDLATIIKVSQAVSSEMVPEKLIDTLMRTAMEKGRAERGFLVLSSGTAPQLAAEAVAGENTVAVIMRDEALNETALPHAVLRHVISSHESAVLDDPRGGSPFDVDPYIRARRPQSAFCLPLINQGNLVGALYLESNFAPNIFAPARVTALKLLASQAAISLENSRLYANLRAQEAKVRRLVEANIIGVVIWDFEGHILEANDTFLGMLGFERHDFVSGRVLWTDLIPPEWRDRAATILQNIKTTGTMQPFETEFLQKGGGRVPVVIGAARLEQNENQGVAFVLNLTDRRRAESEARESERRYRETQMELTHANRIATMGELSASIAHEVNQPITAMIGNAQASLRWLAHQPPDLVEVQQLLKRIAKDGRRVGNIVDRTRDLVKKVPLRMERMQINGAIVEVIELMRGETTKNHIFVRAQVDDELPLVDADRTQIQQVILNLIVNAVHALDEVSRERREVMISSSKSDCGGVLVSVRDSGRGISSEQLDRLFDPFFTTKPNGMGMGLSICRSIIESHGGKIWAAANYPQGAAFHFTVPQCEGSQVEPRIRP
jgi:PAS domain S-box-containing protein